MGISESGRSRSDIETLRRTGRAKVVTLGLMLVGALAAGVWTLVRPAGIGDPEDPRKVLVVKDGTRSGYGVVLRDLGFDAAEGTLDFWEHKAEQEVEDLDVSGVAAVLTLADKFGYAYVVFESPREVDFEGIDLEGPEEPYEDHVQFAVLTAGDYAFPHRMTVNPKPSAVMRDRSLILLQGLFEQERLQRLLPGNEEDEELEDIQLRDRLDTAVARVARIPEAEAMAERILVDANRLLVDEERAEPPPVVVGDSLQSANIVPLPTGAVLTIGRGFQIVSADGVRADLELDDEERIAFGTPGSETWTPCSSLAGGALSVHDSPRHAFSVDGAAVVVKTLSSGSMLWRSKPGAEPGACAFEEVGEIAAAQPGLEGNIVPHRSGKVARTGVLGAHAVVAISDVVSNGEHVLGMLDDVELGLPVWLSDEELAVVGTRASQPDDAGLYVFSLADPLTVLRLDASVFESATDLEEVVAVPQSPNLVVTAGVMPRKLYRLDVPAPWRALFEEGRSQPRPHEAEASGQPVVVELDPNRFTATPLTERGRVQQPHVSPAGDLVTFAIRDPSLDDPDEAQDDEIAVVSLGPQPSAKGRSAGRVRLLTRNALQDHSPRITADGKHVVLRTRLEIPRTNWVVTVPRIIAVPR